MMNIQSTQIEENDGSYVINVGSRTDMVRDVKLIGPEERISEPLKDNIGNEKINLRNFTDRFVYFQLKEPKINDASLIKVQIRFKDNLPKGSIFKLGAHSAPQWNYKWNLLYDPFQRQLDEEYSEIYSDNDISIYSLNCETAERSNVADFFSKIQPDETIAIQPSISLFPGTEELSGYNNSIFNATLNTTLRGKHTFLTYVYGNELSVDIEKQDLNWYNGSDNITIKIVSTTGETVKSAIIPDDGDITDHRGLKETQRSHIQATGLNTGTYKIIIDANDDTLIRDLQVSSDKLIAENNVFAYTPTKLFFSTNNDQAVDFITLHEDGLQTIEVSSGNSTYNITIDKIAVTQNGQIRSAKDMQKMDIPAGDLHIKSKMYYSFTESSYFDPMKCKVLSLNNDFNWLEKNNVDYVMMKKQSIKSENGWITAETEWKTTDLYIKNNMLDFSTNIEQSDGSNKVSVPVDWIKIILE
nr:hypothetical protein [uncultured Methanomethylovorans sp.]